MSEKIYCCPFCGAVHEMEHWGVFHLNRCRIKRFNQACDAALIGLLSGDSDDGVVRQTTEEWTSQISSLATLYACKLVMAIESAAKEKGEE